MAVTAFSPSYQNLAITSTTAQFGLDGGAYGFELSSGSWNGGSATLQKLAADGVTLINASATYTANSAVPMGLPRGIYQITVTGSPMAICANLTRLPRQ